MYIDPDAGSCEFFRAVFAIGNIFLPCLCHVLGHGPEPLWTKYFERLFAPHDPGSKNQIGIAGRVVRVQMSQEYGSQFDAAEAERRHDIAISSSHSSPE